MGPGKCQPQLQKRASERQDITKAAVPGHRVGTDPDLCSSGSSLQMPRATPVPGPAWPSPALPAEPFLKAPDGRDQAGPSQCLGNTVQESAEKTKQASRHSLWERCSIYSSGTAADQAGPSSPALGSERPGGPQPAPASRACSSVVGKVIDEPGRDVQLADFLQSSDASGLPQAHPAELCQGQRGF